MEDAARSKQYAYSATANLVLNAEGRRREGGPSGEVESLTAKKDVKTLLKNMGSRVSFSKPEETAEVKKKRKDREDKDSADDHGRRSKKSGFAVSVEHRGRCVVSSQDP